MPQKTTCKIPIQDSVKNKNLANLTVTIARLPLGDIRWLSDCLKAETETETEN